MEEMKTWSVCPVCRKRIPAEQVTENGAVNLVKTCPEHGRHGEDRLRLFRRKSADGAPPARDSAGTICGTPAVFCWR